VGLGAWLSVSSASAYCRTTTCDPVTEEGGCGRTDDGCFAKGDPLFWPDLCVTFGVHADGSPLRNISYDKAEAAARAAFQSWISADCGGGSHPSIGVVPRGRVYCDQLEFNHDGSESPNAQGPNANIIVFRDDGWPYNDIQRTIALTTITFATKTGEILDADIEVNSTGIALSTSDTAVTSDLQSILTHEVGHFLGLAHSLEPNASMNRNYDRGDLSFRTLSEDDRAGICSIYPGGDEDVEDCTGEEPRYGFSRYCGTPDQADAGVLCSTMAGRTTASGSSYLLSALFAAGAFWVSRRRRS
jgi:hypothetical protein